MNLFPWSRFFAPAQNPLGFDLSDFVLLGLSVLLVAILLTRAKIVSFAELLASRSRLCMAVLFVLPVVLRLALLAQHPVPTPRVADDFSYLLLGDTLAHFRLANPVHPLHRFFEAVFVVQDPSYASIYPLGQGIALAFGELVFRQPWAGVVLSVGALSALCYWMLRAWVSPGWALFGGLLAAIEFGPLSPWMNTYWGGAVSGVAGCLVFGSLPRLRQSPRTRDAVLLGGGLALQLLSRPFEFVILIPIVIFYFVPVRHLLIAALVLLPACGITLLQNIDVTGNWTTLPYQLSRYQYGVPATFTIQANPVPHKPLTVEQQIDYEAQVAVHGQGTDTPGSYFARLFERIRFYRFFFLAPLYLVVPAFLFALKQYRYLWVVMALALFWLGDAFYPYFYPHYIAAASCLFLLISVKSLEILTCLRFRDFAAGKEAAALVVILCLAHFVFLYGVQLAGNQNLLLATSAEESWDSVNYGDSEGRIAIDKQLEKADGRQLVFVRYFAQHGAHEWIQNAADIDKSKVIRAIDLGPDEDEILRRYYPDRHAWLLEPDAHPPKLVAY